MTKFMEDSRWRREKGPIIDEYLMTVKKVESMVAGQGFLYRPGFLGAAITDIERVTKFKLSDINYEIVKQAIERELAQTGHDYDIAVKNAQIAWELEKTALLTALQQEFTNNKKARDLDNQALDRLEITTNLRKLVIMAAKTAIDMDMEVLRQEMTRVDQSTFSAEDALLAAKLLTAQKKLAVIPYIVTVLEKQQLIIAAEEANADRKTALISAKEELGDKRVQLITAREAIADAVVTLIAAKQELVAKKVTLIGKKELIAAQETTNVAYLNQYLQALTGLDDVQKNLIIAKKELIPFINNKSAALIAYTTELDAWVVVKEAIAAIKEQIATYKEERVDRKKEIIESRVDLNTLHLALQEARLNLETARITGRSDLLTEKIENAADWLTERQDSFDATILRDGELIDSQMNFDSYGEWQAFESMKEINDYVIPKEEESIEKIALARINERGELAEVAANAKLTSQLVHLLA